MTAPTLPMTVAEVHGYRVYNHLVSHGPTTKANLAAALGISPGQVETGLRNIREVLADKHSEPIVMDPHTYTYDLPPTEKQAVRYMRYRLSVLHRWINNLDQGTAGPAAAKFNNPLLDMIRLQMTQIKATIEFAMAALP